MSGAGNYCCTDSALPQSAAGAGPRSSMGLGEWRGWGPWPWGGGGGGGVVARDPRASDALSRLRAAGLSSESCPSGRSNYCSAAAFFGACAFRHPWASRIHVLGGCSPSSGHPKEKTDMSTLENTHVCLRVYVCIYIYIYR